jgi:hypothetical protein
MNSRDSNPLVHGYLHLDVTDEPQVAGWRREIQDFCMATGYRLGSIFIDSSTPTGSFARGGLIELLATLRRPDAYAAVVPSLAHLSTDTFLQQVLVHMVQLTNSQLLVSTIVNGSSPQVELPTEPGVGP